LAEVGAELHQVEDCVQVVVGDRLVEKSFWVRASRNSASSAPGIKRHEQPRLFDGEQ